MNIKLEKLDNFYEKSLTWAVGNRWTVIIIAIGLFISSLFLIKVIGTEFMPASDNDRISAQVKLAQGTKLDETILTAQYLDSVYMNKYPEIEIVSTSAGSGDENSIASVFSETGNYIINYTFKMKPRNEREKDIFQIANEMRKDIEVRPEIEKYFVDAGSSRSSGGMGAGGGSVLEVKVFGNNFDETNSRTDFTLTQDHFDLDPGEYKLLIALEDSETGRARGKILIKTISNSLKLSTDEKFAFNNYGLLFLQFNFRNCKGKNNQ